MDVFSFSSNVYTPCLSRGSGHGAVLHDPPRRFRRFHFGQLAEPEVGTAAAAGSGARFGGEGCPGGRRSLGGGGGGGHGREAGGAEAGLGAVRRLVGVPGHKGQRGRPVALTAFLTRSKSHWSQGKFLIPFCFISSFFQILDLLDLISIIYVPGCMDDGLVASLLRHKGPAVEGVNPSPSGRAPALPLILYPPLLAPTTAPFTPLLCRTPSGVS